MNVGIYNHGQTETSIDLGGTRRAIAAGGCWSVDQTLVAHVMARAKAEGCDWRTEPITTVRTDLAARAAATAIVEGAFVPVGLFPVEELLRLKRETLRALASHLQLPLAETATNRELAVAIVAKAAYTETLSAGSSSGRTPDYPSENAGSSPAPASTALTAEAPTPTPSGGEQNTPATNTASASPAVNEKE